MPELPEIQQTQVNEYTSPVQLGSVDQAGREGALIANAGEAVMDFGTVMAKVDQRKRDARGIVDQHVAGAEAQEARIRFEDEARREGRADGKDWTQKFNKPYDRFANELLKRYDDAETRARVYAQLLEVRNNANATLSNDARLAESTAILGSAKELSRLSGSVVFDKPELFDVEAKRFHDNITGLVASGFHTPKDGQKIDAAGVKEIAEKAIQGFIARERFDEAKLFLVKKASDFFSADETRQYLDYVSRAQLNHADRLDKEQTRIDKQAEREAKQVREKNFEEVVRLYVNAKTPDDNRRADEVALQLLGTGGLDSTQHNKLKDIDKSLTTLDDERVSFEIVRKMYSGASLSALRKEVNSLVSGDNPSGRPMLGPKAGVTLLDKIAARERSEESDPLMAKSWRDADIILKTKFLQAKNPAFPNYFTQQQQEQYMQATDKLFELVRRGKYKYPSDAAHAVVQTQRGYTPDYVPRIPVQQQLNSKRLEEAGKKVMQIYKSKSDPTFTKQRFKEFLDVYEERLKYLQEQEALKKQGR